MPVPEFDILVVGNLANFDFIVAENLSRLGFSCVVVRVEQPAEKDSLPLEFIAFDSNERVLQFRGHCWMYGLCRKAKCVIAITGILPWLLKYFWLLAKILPFPPVVNYCTGSDITELIRERSLNGLIYRSLVRGAALNVLAGAPEILRSALDYKIVNSIFIRSPYMLGVNRPQDVENSGPLVFLHPSNIDWGKSDTSAGRNSTKGNDRFIRAFLRSLDAGCNAKCILLDRGPDRAVARRMIEESGHANAFEWYPTQSPKALADLIVRADIVVDQFDVGCLGGIATEAMSYGKPVMTYVDRSSVSVFYDVPPPLINCRSEDEIFNAILSNQDRNLLRRMGRAADRWVRINHGINADFRELAFRICMLTGLAWPRRQDA